MNYIVFLLLLVLPIAACTGKKGKNGRINLIEKEGITARDAKTQGYYDNKYYLPNVVRLDQKTKGGFIYIDSLKYKPEGLLDRTTREAYYKKALALVDKNELQAQRAIWALPEVQRLQEADGGYSTIVTYITAKPAANHYVIELRKNNIEDMTPQKGISSFTVKLRPLQIEIANESGYYVSLRAWRSGRK